jgi:HD-GYP domain-containing protein (c-di-GMP phosphodiesterase class II)
MIKLKADSLLRKFSIFYVGFAVIPIIILFYLYSLYDETHTLIQLSDAHFTILLVLVGTTSLIGFFGMRIALKRIVTFAKSIEKSTFEKVDEKVLIGLAKEKGEVAELAKSFGQILKRLDDNLHQLEETKKTLHDVLTKVSEVLSSVENFDNLIRLVLETAVDALGAKNGALFSVDDNQYTLKAWVGGESVAAEQVMTASRSYLDLITKENRTFVLPAMENSGRGDDIFDPPLVCTPLNYRGKTWGGLCLSGNRYSGNFSDDDLTIVSNLSHQIAVAFENAKLNEDAEQTYFETMAALAMAVEARDPYSRGHSDRVGEYARKIGYSMGLPEDSIQTLRDASRLHDVGKIGIRDAVLVKPGTLNLEERDIIRKHPVIGESIVTPLKTFKHLLDPIRHHHEQLDGSGYPDGLKGEAITPITRILVVADIYDALTSNRPYRQPMDIGAIKKEFDHLVSVGKIDAEVVRHLYAVIDRGDLPPRI